MLETTLVEEGEPICPDFDTVIAKAQVGGGATSLFVPTFP